MAWYFDDLKYESWAYIDSFFTSEECRSIIDHFSDISKLKKAKVGSGKDSVLNTDIRNSNVHFMDITEEDSHWIFSKVATGIWEANRQIFDFDIDYIETFQFSEYDSFYEGHYGRHVDIGSGGHIFRKLSFSIQLTDPDEYEGGDLLLYSQSQPTYVRRDLGSMAVFPSYTLHEVTPVTKGKRYSLVGWVKGKKFR